MSLLKNRFPAIGIDVGGTFIKMGLVRGKQILSQKVIPTHYSSPRQMQEGLIEMVREFRAEYPGRLAGVGLGIPGLVNYATGVVYSCANLRGWKNVPLRDILKRRLKLPVQVENDVNVMALAEWTYGAGRGVSNLVCMTLGTGVGGGLVLNDQLYRGGLGWAGEIGHMPISADGPRCACGGRACLERTVGNKEIIAWVRQQLAAGAQSRITELVEGQWDKIVPEVIDRACEQGDRFAQKTWERVGTTIGVTLAGVVNLLNPDKIVIGGGISKAGKWLFNPIRRTVRERAMRGPGRVPIVPAQLGSSAGLIGAALLAQGGGE